MRAYPSQFSVSALLLALAALAVGIVIAVGAASAHHPGSQAVRLPGDKLRLEVMTTVADGCTAIDGVVPGAPDGSKGLAAAPAMTIVLRRPPGAQVCPQGARTLSRTVVVAAPSQATAVRLYVLNAQGRLHASEKLRIN